eukprot:GHRR01024539.1.p1 GENE.GHRR01024539.1~~GHRR01024539.1.p1  ORF type:complete len:572 (+),score=242.27 GHRR01024539.1:796-2511(+)
MLQSLQEGKEGSQLVQQQQAVPLSDVVEGAKQQAVQALSGALERLECQLIESGLSDQAEAVRTSKRSVVKQVSQAADTIKNYVQKEGLSSVPATELTSIITRIVSGRAATVPRFDAAATTSSLDPAFVMDAPAAQTVAIAVADEASTNKANAAAAATVAAAAAIGARVAAESGQGQDDSVAAAVAASIEEAVISGKLPQLTQEAMPGAWKALASVAGKMIEEVFQPVAYIDNIETDTQVWVHVSKQLREVVVAFRGTEQVKWKDLISDLNLIPQTLDVERTSGIDLGFGALPLPFASFKTNTEIMVHSGFLKAYDTVKTKVLKIVDQLTADASAAMPWTIFVTGHSLGGALATLAAYDLAGRRGLSAVGRHVVMYTFGAPRVGNKAFADAFAQRMKGAAWRITNSADIVPSIPRLMGYAHVRTGVRLDDKGQLVFEDSIRYKDDILGEGREVAEVVLELASQALEVVQGKRALVDVMDAIREHEMEILNALVDGSALGQHMENFYLATLKEAVLATDPALAERVAAAMEQAAAAVQKETAAVVHEETVAAAVDNATVQLGNTGAAASEEAG